MLPHEDTEKDYNIRLINLVVRTHFAPQGYYLSPSEHIRNWIYIVNIKDVRSPYNVAFRVINKNTGYLMTDFNFKSDNVGFLVSNRGVYKTVSTLDEVCCTFHVPEKMEKMK